MCHSAIHFSLLDVSDAESPYSSVPVIPYKELEEATALWSPHNLLGRGGFGAVYRGTWKNTEVAIKRIEPVSLPLFHPPLLFASLFTTGLVSEWFTL